MTRFGLLLIGSVATALAFAGAILPGLPTTPFLLLALWAFARSNKALHDWLLRVPLLRGAIAEAQRFETDGSVRLSVKITAMAFAWGAVLLFALTGAERSPLVLALLIGSAAAGTLFMCWVPTHRD